MSGMPWRSSLRVRLLVGTLVWVIVSVLLAGWGIHRLFERHVTDQLQSELVVYLDQLTAAIQVDATGLVSLSAPLIDPRFDRPFSGLYWQIRTVDEVQGAVQVLRSRSLWDTTLPEGAASVQDGADRRYVTHGPQNQSVLVRERLVQPAEGPSAELELQIAADQALLAEPISRFTTMLVIALGILTLGLVLAVLMQVWVGLSPLTRLRAQLARVRAGETARIDGAFPSEVQPLVEDFNTVLQTNAEMLERARTQAGNLAHALKTPLAVMANAAAAHDAQLPRLVDEQIAVARRQVDYHLAHARAAASVRVSGLHSPVRPVLSGLVRVMERVHASRELKFDIQQVPDDLAFKGEEQDFQEMLGNVLDNACKWAATRVRVRATEGAGMLRLVVEDDGAGLAPERAEAVFLRGVRADERAAGSGLGLAIVRDLARLYGGDATIENSDLGGVRLVLVLPAAARELC